MIFLLCMGLVSDSAASSSGVLEDELMSGLRPLKPELEVVVQDDASGAALWVWPVVIVLCLLCALLWFWKCRKRGNKLSAEDEAMASLAVISEKGLDDGGFVMEVSKVIKGYLEAKGEGAVLRQTTEEFLSEFRGSDLFQTHGVALKRFFVLCDMVKFAGNELASEGRQELADLAGVLVSELSQEFLNKEAKV